MSQLHGLLLCSGNATRFAQSVDASPPYPKHLEKIGDKTLLEISIENLIANLGVNAVTVTLNPDLQFQYIPHLKEIENKHPDVLFSYTITLPNEDTDTHAIDGICEGVRRDIAHGVYALDGSEIAFEDPVCVLAYGDAIVEIEDTERLQCDIDNLNPQLQEGFDLMIDFVGSSSSTVYYLGKRGFLKDYYFRTDGITAAHYGCRMWNINTVEDLNRARRDFGYEVHEGETLLPYRGKEIE